MTEPQLWDLKQLLKHYPAFKEWGVRWLIRNRRIPIVRIGSRRIFFDPEDIKNWIDSQKVEPVQGYNQYKILRGRKDDR